MGKKQENKQTTKRWQGAWLRIRSSARTEWTWNCFSKISGRVELIIRFLSWGLCDSGKWLAEVEGVLCGRGTGRSGLTPWRISQHSVASDCPTQVYRHPRARCDHTAQTAKRSNSLVRPDSWALGTKREHLLLQKSILMKYLIRCLRLITVQ